MTTTNTDGGIFIDEMPELPDGASTSGYIESELDSSETLETVTTAITQDIEERASLPMNRAQRRALMKKAGKKGRAQLSSIEETAKKLDYIDLIQKLRALNKKKEKEENEQAAKD